ncbi:phosphonate ABC transporter, permease protein PhnE [Oceanospirillum sediminis]|uniref:Phosphonate ABC transporter, permease protein PhnE n=1 Tax=Oceanospirillum sediminis TaxID=2760088 RepID=A0A839ITA6_9GAMM|nr:phosphonate ABC transporter, permease protein PhnE [Oceanospirillum sediminis]MBB1487376.1 phosphonate ABC transporter, permease protein PhnE [Oceanospirillum sediminis]
MSTINHQWERFTFQKKLARFAVYLVTVAAFLASIRTVDVIPEFFYDAPNQISDMFSRMWPLDTAFYPITVHAALMETLHIATLGTLVTLIFAVPLALLNARNVVANPVVNWISRFFLVSSRSVNSLVWALLFVAVFGPGVIAGVLAIAFRSVGFIGKLLAEAIEEINMGTIEALRATGASWASVLIKGYWPQVKPAFFSIVLFRWDINVRESAVLGLVGAGGIGVVLNDAMNLFEWQKVSMVLFSIFAVVILAEILVVQIRKRMI